MCCHWAGGPDAVNIILPAPFCGPALPRPRSLMEKDNGSAAPRPPSLQKKSSLPGTDSEPLVHSKIPVFSVEASRALPESRPLSRADSEQRSAASHLQDLFSGGNRAVPKSRHPKSRHPLQNWYRINFACEKQLPEEVFGHRLGTQKANPLST